ncbi:MAG: chemotaxis protein CheB [Lachnospira eligens]
MVLVQHMPAGFTASLAARLNEISDINVKEGADGDVIQKGWVYIALEENISRLSRKHLSM